jgi:DMSO/TMAO reductase YedYZ molybdopterin-dependent catalytic subunit
MMYKLIALTLLVTVLVVSLASAGCASPTPTTEPNGELPEVEIREYEGENLSSINDFRENSIRGPQYVDTADYTLAVHGLVDSDTSYSYDDVLSSFPSYKKVVTLYCVEGWDVTLLWEGILLEELFNEVGVLPGANTVIFRSVDGYSTSLPLDYILDNELLLAFKMNDVTLPPERGFPFELVAESKWGYKWIKWVNDIELSDDPDFKGYWEGFGYSNDGSLDRSFFD